MKKIFTVLFISLLFGALSASENLKVKVRGHEHLYNQVRVTNNTNLTDFDVKVYILSETSDEKFVVKQFYGQYHLKEFDDTDTCAGFVERGQILGITLPEGAENINCSVVYKDYPFFDVIQIILTSEDEFLEGMVF